MQRVVVISYRRFGTTYRSHQKESTNLPFYNCTFRKTRVWTYPIVNIAPDSGVRHSYKQQNTTYGNIVNTITGIS